MSSLTNVHAYSAVLTIFSRCCPTSILFPQSIFISLSSLLSCPLHHHQQEPKALQSLFISPLPPVKTNSPLSKHHHLKRLLLQDSRFIILWDYYFIFTPLFLSLVIEIYCKTFVCFHCIPTHIFPEKDAKITKDAGYQINRKYFHGRLLEPLEGHCLNGGQPSMCLKVNMMLFKLDLFSIVI